MHWVCFGNSLLSPIWTTFIHMIRHFQLTEAFLCPVTDVQLQPARKLTWLTCKTLCATSRTQCIHNNTVYNAITNNDQCEPCDIYLLRFNVHYIVFYRSFFWWICLLCDGEKMQICIGQVCKYPYLKLLQIYLFRPSLKILGDLGLSLLMRNGKSPSALDTLQL